MSKIVIGLGAAAVAVVGGYFGTEAYIRHRIASEIEANFAQIRAGGGQAKHGDLTFSLWTRDVTLSDIAVEFTAPRPAKIKVARFAAKNLGQDGSDHFTASEISLSGIEANELMALPDGGKLDLKMPSLEIADFRGPSRLQSQPTSSAPLDVYRFALQQSAAIRASSFTAPSLSATMTGGKFPPGTGYTYSDLSIRDVKDGKIGTATIGRVNLNASFAYAGKNEQLIGEISGMKTDDIDMTAMAALLDPAYAKDDKTYRLMRQMTAGTYTIKSDKNYTIRIDSFSNGEVKAQPSRLKLPALAALVMKTGTSPDLAQSRELMDVIPGLYEGLSIADTSLKGLSVESPDGNFKLATLRFGLEGGKVGEFVVEGLDGKSPDGPVKFGRFALKGFDVAGMLRMSSKFSTPGRKPSTDDLMGMLTLLEGFELKDLVAPHKGTNKLISLHEAALSWGQFVGPIPTKAHLKLKMTGPLEEKDGEPFTLLRDVGINEATADMDIGLAWNESEKKLVLTPGTFAIEKLFSVEAKTSLNNVPRGLFTTNPQQAMMAALPIEYGAIEIVGRDLGAVDLSIAQYARKQNVSTAEARSTLATDIRTKGRAAGNNDPVSGRLADAVATFIEKPNGTLALKITPRAKLPVMQFIELTKNDPSAMFSLFDIDIQTK